MRVDFPVANPTERMERALMRAYESPEFNNKIKTIIEAREKQRRYVPPLWKQLLLIEI